MMKLSLILYLIISLLIGCTKNPESAGGVVDTGNTISAKVVDKDKNPANNVSIYIRSENYVASIDSFNLLDPSGMVDAYTNEDGEFVINSIEPGNYSLEINDNKGNAALIKLNIPDTDTSFQIPDIVLNEMGFVEGMVDLMTQENVYVLIPGLERIEKVDSITGIFELQIPEGNFQLLFYSVGNNEPLDIIDSVFVNSKDTIYLLPNSNWNQRFKITINTSATGAGVTETLNNFPLLIRIDSSHNVMENSLSKGEDIRFTKSKENLFLPYEIESWDAGRREAIIWVNIDTLYGDNENQFIYMYVGNINTSNQTSKQFVFDTVNSFEGVYHLGDVDDASSNNRNGINTGVPFAQGIIGQAVNFEKDDSLYIELPPTSRDSVSPNSTIEFWFKPESEVTGGFIMADGWANGIIHFQIIYEKITVSINPHPNRGISDTLLSDQWYHTAMTTNTNNSKLTLYMNGEIKYTNDEFNSTANITKGLTMGAWKDTTNSIYARYFDGMMDEVRISFTDRSPSWIKMSYENQKEGSTVIWIE